MSVFLATANFSTLLNGSITNSAVTINVTPGSGALIPTIGAGEVVSATLVDSATRSVFETIHITSVVTDALTVVRAQDGSSAHAYASGDILFIGMTAEDYRACVQADQLQAGTYSKATASGTANALTATVSSSLTAVPDGLHITVVAAAANTGAATLDLTLGVTIIGALPIVKLANVALQPGDIPAAGYPIELVYSATFGAWVMQNPASYTPNSRPGHTYTGSDWYWIDKANGEFCQFTLATISSGSTITFPVPFPTSCERVIAVHGSGATGPLSFGTGTFDRFGAVVFHSAGTPANMTVIAWGH